MKDAVALLLGSRKFLVTSLAVITLGAFVAMGKITPDQFMAYLEKLTMVLVAAIGAEVWLKNGTCRRPWAKRLTLLRSLRNE